MLFNSILPTVQLLSQLESVLQILLLLHQSNLRNISNLFLSTIFTAFSLAPGSITQETTFFTHLRSNCSSTKIYSIKWQQFSQIFRFHFQFFFFYWLHHICSWLKSFIFQKSGLFVSVFERQSDSKAETIKRSSIC